MNYFRLHSKTEGRVNLVKAWWKGESTCLKKGWVRRAVADGLYNTQAYCMGFRKDKKVIEIFLSALDRVIFFKSPYQYQMNRENTKIKYFLHYLIKNIFFVWWLLNYLAVLNSGCVVCLLRVYLSLPAFRLLLQAQLDQVVQCCRVVFGGRALRSLRSGSTSQTSSRNTLSDPRIHTRARHLERPHVSERVRGDVKETTVRTPQLLKQHLKKKQEVSVH